MKTKTVRMYPNTIKAFHKEIRRKKNERDADYFNRFIKMLINV